MQINSLKRDTAAIEAGQWVSNIPDFGDVVLKVRGLSSAAYERAVAKLSRAVPKAEREEDGSLSLDASYSVIGTALAEAVLLDWEHIEDGDAAIAYDPDLAKRWLTDRDYRQFAAGVAYAAREVDAGRVSTEDLAKN